MTGGIGTGYLINVKSSNDSTNSELVSIIPKLDEVFRFINARYWEEVDVVELENKGLKGILQKLKLDSEKKNIELNFEDKIDSSTRENRVEEGIGFI
ncbi:MAG: hypothetical protein GY810_15230 [Aureispira sp.]|nr:hypothetical protein [Aureispira sp.]